MILGDRKLKAVTGFVIVESDEHEKSETVLKSGLVLPHKEKHNIWVRGTIHSAGPIAKYDNNHRVVSVHDAPVQDGEEILYRKYEGERIEFADRILYRLPYERVRLVVEGSDDLG